MSIKVSHQVGIVASIAFVLFVVFLLLKPSATQTHQAKQEQLFEHKFFLFDQPRVLSKVMLSNMTGESKLFSEHLQGWRIVNFGYMFCPDICPINLALLNDIKVAWDQEHKAGRYNESLGIVHVTFDPARDTPDVMQPYLNYMNPAFYGLTGDLEQIRRLAQQLNMVFIHEKPDDQGHYFITHSDSMALINPKGEYVGIFKGPYEQDRMLKALALLIENNS